MALCLSVIYMVKIHADQGTLGGLDNKRGTTGVKFAADPLKLMLTIRNSEKEMRCKKTSRGTDDGDIDLSNSTSGFLVDSGILCEILSRLPVKSLVRFKCVCKYWRFLIQEDSYFINSHFNQSKKHPILLFIPDTDEHPHGFLLEGMIEHESPYQKVEIETIGLMLEGKGRTAPTASLDTIRKMEIPEENVSFSAPVNGLICCHLIRKYHDICICNISTQEISPWIKSNVLMNVQGKEIRTRRIPCYELGFDPTTKKHKVICILHIHNPTRSLCEVLTVGDNEWRRIENSPIELRLEYHRRKHTVYLNGFIYFCTSNFMKADELGNDKIVAFDVGAEKFRVITVPNFILNHPRYFNEKGRISSRLIEVKGCLGLLIKMKDSTANLWVFDGMHGSNKGSTINSNNQNWTEVTIELPYLWSADARLYFHSILGTDQIIIESRDKLHSYNWKTKSCQEIDISGFECYPLMARVSTTVESLLHVQ